MVAELNSITYNFKQVNNHQNNPYGSFNQLAINETVGCNAEIFHKLNLTILKSFFFLLTALLICPSVNGQVSDTINNETNNIRIYCKAQDLESVPYFVLVLGKNEIEFDNEKLGLVDLGWVENVNVLKEEIAIKKFGSKAEHGAILIKIKDEKIKDLKKKLRAIKN